MDEHKTESDKESVLQSKLDVFNNQIQQTSLTKLLSSPSELQFQRNYQIKEKDSAEQNTMEKSFSDNIKENTKIYPAGNNDTIPFNTNKVTDYYGQISQPLVQMFFNAIELQKDYVNAFQPLWTQHIKTNIENYLSFQDKMMLLYLDMFSISLKNILIQ